MAKKSQAQRGSEDSMDRALSSLADVWAGTEARKGGFDVPEGEYEAIIEKAILNLSKNSDRLQVSLTYRILEGDYANSKVFAHDGLNNELGISFFKEKLNRLDIESPDSIDDLHAAVEEMEGKEIELLIKEKDGFTNCYINGLLGNNPKKTASKSFNVGDEVTAKSSDGKYYDGEIIKITKDKATIEFSDGEKVTVLLSSLNKG